VIKATEKGRNRILWAGLSLAAAGGEVESQRRFAFEYRLQVIESNGLECLER
jgi:hypothetical protein